MGQIVDIDGQPIEVEQGDTVADLKYKAGIDDEKIMHGNVDGEMMALNSDDPAELIDDHATTLPDAEGQIYG